jgi:DNA polymerase III subunit delta'
MPKKDDSVWSVIGHQLVIRYLQRHITNGTPSHAYLFYGPAQVGKTTVAQDFISCLFTGQPGTDLDRHPDIVWLSRATDEKTGKLKKNISIEQVRQLIDRLSLSSFGNGYKVAVIQDAHSLSAAAINGLLKTMEEPTAKTVLILLTNDIEFIPGTIISRCQTINFFPVATQTIAAALEDRGVKRQAAQQFASLSYGRPGLALDYQADRETYQNYQASIEQSLAFSDQSLIEQFDQLAELLGSFQPAVAGQLLEYWEKAWRDVLLAQWSVPGLVVHQQFEQTIKTLAGRYSRPAVISLLRQITQAKRYLAANINPRFLFENLALNF